MAEHRGMGHRWRLGAAPGRVALGAAIGGALLAGCSTLPSSGPTSAQIKRDVRRDNGINFRIVDIEPAIVDELSAVEPQPQPLSALANPGRVDTIGIGDGLTINIYEVGVSLFGSGGASATGFDPGARGTPLTNVVVDQDGNIVLPYVGRLQVAGRTPSEVAKMIESGMAGLSQRPQAQVAVTQNQFNTIYVSGDVRTPSRLPLGLPRERLLDAIARAGGSLNQPNDMVVRLTRDGQSVETRLSEIAASGPQNVALQPGDRIELFNRPRTFLVFGSTLKVSQVAFGASSLSLAEALARIGGPSDATADPAAIYLFRYSAQPAPGSAGQPVIYRLNMRRAQSYFLSQRFEMQDKDVIYISSAAANAPGKLAAILGQLFSPFLAIRSVAQ